MQNRTQNHNRSAAAEMAAMSPLETPRAGRWQFGPLLVSHLLAALLLVSWLSQPARSFWDAIDLQVFRWLNGSLAIGHWWQQLWAFANCRGFDLVAGLFILALLAYAIKADQQQRALEGWISVATLSVGVLAVRVFVESFIIGGGITYERPSPTLVLDDILRLSELVPATRAKEASHWCFPSDHGAILWSFAIYLCYRSTRWIAAAGCLMAVVFCLPRLVAGGHWFTDIAVGSAVMALLTTAWVLATPLHDSIVDIASRLVERVVPNAWKAGVNDPQNGDRRRAA